MDHQRQALASAFATLKALADNSLSPTQTKMATRAAGECLWGLGLSDYDGIKACRPVRDTIDMTAVPKLTDH